MKSFNTCLKIAKSDGYVLDQDNINKIKKELGNQSLTIDRNSLLQAEQNIVAELIDNLTASKDSIIKRVKKADKATIKVGRTVSWKNKKGEIQYGVVKSFNTRTKSWNITDHLTNKNKIVLEKKLSITSIPSPKPKKKKAVKDNGVIGKNASGQNIYEDENGVRKYEENGVLIGQPVDVIPTRGSGISIASDNVDTLFKKGRTQFLTQEELNLRQVKKDTPKDTYGGDNIIFTQDAASKARALLKSKLNQLNAGLDPEIALAGIQLAGYHIEAGARSFSAYSKAMVLDIGDAIKPYLRSFYESVRHYPGFNNEGMTEPQDIKENEDVADNDGTTDKTKSDDDKTVTKGSEPKADEVVKDSRGTEKILEGKRTTDDGNVQGSPSEDSVRGKKSGKRKGKRTGTNKPSGTRSETSVDPNSFNVAGFQKSDHRIKPGSIDRVGSWKKTAEKNLDAIETVTLIEKEDRVATPEEQDIMAQYVGWGASELANSMFPGYARTGDINIYQVKEGWKNSVLRMQKLLSKEEIKAAASSTQNAHFTSEPIINSIYSVLKQFGFKGGKMIEPGMGVGNFVGLIPSDMKKVSHFTGIEKDIISSKIAKHLYPEQTIISGDYAKQIFPTDFFDVGIGNPPFSKTKILSDPEYKKKRFSLHNFFFAKTIDRIKPGGLMVFVTSRYTMDAMKNRARDYLDKRAHFIGAVRLPQSAFKENAGTEVVTDILFFQKKGENVKDHGLKWLSTKEITAGMDKIKYNINEYFVDNPEMILGKNSDVGSMYGKQQYTVIPTLSDTTEGLFKKAIKK